MWSTQRRWCPSATTRSLPPSPVQKSPLPLKKHGGSSDSKAWSQQTLQTLLPAPSSVDCWKTPSLHPNQGLRKSRLYACCLFYKHCSCKPGCPLRVPKLGSNAVTWCNPSDLRKTLEVMVFAVWCPKRGSPDSFSHGTRGGRLKESSRGASREKTNKLK